MQVGTAVAVGTLSVAVGLACAGCSGKQDTGANVPVEYAEALADDEDPDTFQVKFETSKGEFIVEVHPSWAPKGAARFRELVESGFYDDCRFFRVVPDFVVQFGINGDPQVQAKWRDKTIEDDPVRRPNKRGAVTFATSGPNSRTTQIFINLKDNSHLDEMGFAPFGVVVSGMSVVDSIESKYRQIADQGRIQMEGNAYLTANFPDMDYVIRATVVDDSSKKTGPTPPDSGGQDDSP
ncbi:MAG: peptidylprolyl isomerase [Planctomycetes bacterium]|nr:peptidylprolyl isomerase [Planctomycetota bacterium]